MSDERLCPKCGWPPALDGRCVCYWRRREKAKRRLRPLLGLALFFALVGFAWLGLAILTGWPGLALVIAALLAIATLPGLR